MTFDLPPKPRELAEQVISDTASRVPFCVELVASRLVEQLRDRDDGDRLIRGEELGEREVDALWEERRLGPMFAHALAEVKAAYIRHVDLIDHVAGELAQSGPESWIAQALRHRFAFEATWEALDRLGELEPWPDEVRCAACGAALGTSAAVEVPP